MGSPQRRTLFGAIELASGRWFHLVTTQATSAGFLTPVETTAGRVRQVHAFFRERS